MAFVKLVNCNLWKHAGMWKCISSRKEKCFSVEICILLCQNMFIHTQELHNVLKHYTQFGNYKTNFILLTREGIYKLENEFKHFSQLKWTYFSISSNSSKGLSSQGICDLWQTGKKVCRTSVWFYLYSYLESIYPTHSELVSYKMCSVYTSTLSNSSQ